jgi:hypothetical protein
MTYQPGDIIVAGGGLLLREDTGGTWPTDPKYRWTRLERDTTFRLVDDPADAVVVAALIPGTLRWRPVVDLNGDLDEMLRRPA